MPLPWEFMRRCSFCKKRRNLSFVLAYGIYGQCAFQKYAYHNKCLEKVMEDPEKYGHKLVDKALEIVDAIKKDNDLKGYTFEKLKEKSRILKEEFNKIPWWKLEKYNSIPNDKGESL